MTGTYGRYIEGTDITNVVHKIMQMRTAKHLALARARRSGVRIPAGELHFKFYKKVQNGSEAQPSFLFNGHRGSMPGVKGPGRKVTLSPSSKAKVTNSGAIPPFLLYGFVVWTRTTVPLFTFVNERSLLHNFTQ